MCRGEITVAVEVLRGGSRCLDSAAGGDAVKLVNPVETGISSAGGARCGGQGLSLRTLPCCGAPPAPLLLHPFENPPQAPSDPVR